MVRKKVTAWWLKDLLDQSAKGLVLMKTEKQGNHEEIKA